MPAALGVHPVTFPWIHDDPLTLVGEDRPMNRVQARTYQGRRVVTTVHQAPANRIVAAWDPTAAWQIVPRFRPRSCPRSLLTMQTIGLLLQVVEI